MGRQYLAVRFKPLDRRTYTYHNDGEPVAVGDEVKVPDRSGDGWQRVVVTSADEATPTFATKAILGLAPPDLPVAAQATAVAPRIGNGALVEGFRWRTREGELIAPAAMATRHLFYTLRMIWNCHVPPNLRVGTNIRLYEFSSHYTPAYFEEAITNLAAELFPRPDLAGWQRAELEQMAAHTVRRAPNQLALSGV